MEYQMDYQMDTWRLCSNSIRHSMVQQENSLPEGIVFWAA